MVLGLLLFPLKVAGWLANPLAAPLWRRSARRALLAALASRGLTPDEPIALELGRAKRCARNARARVAVRDGARRFVVEAHLSSAPRLVPRWELRSLG